MKGQINENYIKYANKVFDYFINLNCKVGEGGFYFRWLYSQAGKLKMDLINKMFMVAQNLIENGYLNRKDNDFICLTQSGYDYTQGANLVCNSIDLTHYVNCSESDEKQFNQLWEIIGPDKTALFYVKGPDYYKVARSYVPNSFRNYMAYIHSLGEDRQSRVLWYRELYLSISDDLKGAFLKELSDQIQTIYEDYVTNTDGDDDELNTALSVIEDISNKQEINVDTLKPVKIFISHSSNDRNFVKAFVDLLISIGISKPEQLFCSSYSGFDIGLNRSIFDTLRQQYNDYRLYMIYMLSENYYRSPISLNEMGAGWVLQYDGQCIVLPKYNVNDIKGCIDKNKIALVVDNNDFNLRLNEFKDNIIKIMGLEGINNNLWEQKRDEFINKVKP